MGNFLPLKVKISSLFPSKQANIFRRDGWGDHKGHLFLAESSATGRAEVHNYVAILFTRYAQVAAVLLRLNFFGKTPFRKCCSICVLCGIFAILLSPNRKRFLGAFLCVCICTAGEQFDDPAAVQAQPLHHGFHDGR